MSNPLLFKKNKKKYLTNHPVYAIINTERGKENPRNQKGIKRMNNNWTVYFGDYSDVSGKVVDTPEKIQKIVDSYKDFGCFVREVEPGAWFIER